MLKRKEVDYLNALNRQYREAKEKIENRDKFIEHQQKELEKIKDENLRYYMFKLTIENILNGKRKPEEIIDKIKKELLSLR